MSLELCNNKPCAGSICLPSYPPFPSLPQRLVFCRWAWRLALSVLHGSLQQNQYLRTICAALLPGGWCLMLQVYLQFQPCLDLPGTDSQFFSGHRYLTKKTAKCILHTFTCGQPCSRVDACTFAFANLWEEDDWTRPQGILEGFCITIFTFNEMVHSMHLHFSKDPYIVCFLFKNPQTHFQHACYQLDSVECNKYIHWMNCAYRCIIQCKKKESCFLLEWDVSKACQ